MAELKLENLVLHGVRVACHVVTGLERNGSNQASGPAPAVRLSFPRHLSASDSSGSDPGMRYDLVTMRDVAYAALRAGRPERPAGVLGCRGPARTAGRAILSGMSHARGGTAVLTTCWHGRFKAGAGVAQGQLLQGLTCDTRHEPILAAEQAIAGLTRTDKRAEEVLVTTEPPHGMSGASLRGR
jgi:hypothetical protein